MHWLKIEVEEKFFPFKQLFVNSTKEFVLTFYTLRKNAIESIAFLYKNMHITDSNQYAIELVTYLWVLVVYFYEFIVYMLLERNAFDSIAFFSQCRECRFTIKNEIEVWDLLLN